MAGRGNNYSHNNFFIYKLTKIIKNEKVVSLMLVFMTLLFVLVSCERVAPNYAGVLMENYGKQGKEDFKVVSGRVSTWDGGTELFQVPLFDQRGEFSAPVTLKALIILNLALVLHTLTR